MSTPLIYILIKIKTPDMLHLFDSVEALTDPTVWAVTLISFTNALPTGGLGAFSNIIISAFVRGPPSPNVSSN